MAQTRDGGKPIVKDLPYSPPVGPQGINNGPGSLGGTNHGQGGSQNSGGNK